MIFDSERTPTGAKELCCKGFLCAASLGLLIICGKNPGYALIVPDLFADRDVRGIEKIEMANADEAFYPRWQL
jgi:hypothetical protein